MFPALTRDDVYRIETERLWLRWPRVADADAITTLAGDRQLAEKTARIPHPYPQGEAEAAIFRAREANAAGRAVVLAIAPKGRPNDLLGMISLSPNGEGAPELGFWLGRPFWGRGLMTEAAQAMIDTAFVWSRMQTISAGVFVGNAASRSVLRKCGFQPAGMGMCQAPARGGAVSSDQFLLTRSTWASLKNWRAPVVEGLALDRQRADLALACP
jgi:RimJ/RimL family protein N-acetyltransferase